MLELQLNASDRRITPEIVSQFGNLIRRKLSGPDPTLRREYIRLLVDRVEVGDRTIRISGSNSTLQRAVVASQTAGAEVPKAERRWRTRQDSNLWPLPSEGSAGHRRPTPCQKTLNQRAKNHPASGMIYAPRLKKQSPLLQNCFT